MRPFMENAAHRSFQACLECRKSKLKCDGLSSSDSVCSRCRQKGKQCTWSVHVPGPGSSGAGEGAGSVHQAGQRQGNPYPDAAQREQRSARSFSTSGYARDVGGEEPMGSTAGVSFPVTLHVPQQHTPRPLPHVGSQAGTGRRARRQTDIERTSKRKRQRTGSNGGKERPPDGNSHTLNSLFPSSSAIIPSVSLSDLALLSPTTRRRRRTASKGKEREVNATSASLTGAESVEDYEDEAYGDSEGRSFASESDNDSTYSSSLSRGTSAKKNVDEQIRALQHRMGWSQANLAKASEERRAYFRDATAKEPKDLLNSLDPITANLITQDEAQILFDKFYSTINVQHCLFDSRSDTWQSIRARSTALFVTMCAVAALVDDDIEQPISPSSTREMLKSHEECLSILSAHNVKSTEFVLILLLSFLFMQKPAFARQDRCWNYIDSAARIASELGLGKRLQTPIAFASDAIHAPTGEDVLDESHETLSRIRGEERAWATAALMQRSLGTFTGLGSTVSIHIEWSRLQAWCESEQATVGDVQHAAYLNLRRIETFTQSQLRKMEDEQFFSLESIRVGFNTLFVEWQERWVEHERLKEQYAQKSFLLVVGLHICLLVNLSTLQLARQAAKEGKKTTAMYKVNQELEDICGNLAMEFCQFFLNNFEHRARHLGRNLISMVAWGVLVLLQLRYRKGRLLATRVAVLLAGFSHDEISSSSFPRFYGRWLLSLINDLASAGGQSTVSQSIHRGLGLNEAATSIQQNVDGPSTGQTDTAEPEPHHVAFIPTEMQNEQQWNVDLAAFLSQPSQAGPPMSTFDNHWLGSYFDVNEPDSGH